MFRQQCSVMLVCLTDRVEAGTYRFSAIGTWECSRTSPPGPWSEAFPHWEASPHLHPCTINTQQHSVAEHSISYSLLLRNVTTFASSYYCSLFLYFCLPYTFVNLKHFILSLFAPLQFFFSSGVTRWLGMWVFGGTYVFLASKLPGDNGCLHHQQATRLLVYSWRSFCIYTRRDMEIVSDTVTPSLPSIILGATRSLANKVDELNASMLFFFFLSKFTCEYLWYPYL